MGGDEVHNYASMFKVGDPVSYRDQGSSVWYESTVSRVNVIGNTVHITLADLVEAEVDFTVKSNRSRVLARKPLPDPTHIESNPYAGSTKLPPNAGKRTELLKRPEEHRPNGMLNGARVKVRSSSWHGSTVHVGRIVDFNSVPAAHIVIDCEANGRDEPVRRIVFCASIEYVEAT